MIKEVRDKSWLFNRKLVAMSGVDDLEMYLVLYHDRQVLRYGPRPVDENSIMFELIEYVHDRNQDGHNVFILGNDPDVIFSKLNKDKNDETLCIVRLPVKYHL